MSKRRLFSNEIVFRGHPDKVCDQISGAILNECLKQDKKSRVAVEVAGGKNVFFVTGEITTNADYNTAEIIRRVLLDIGYKDYRYAFINNVGKQSNDISQGVEGGGAGDQGMMFGYACNDTPQLLPTAQVILQEFANWYDSHLSRVVGVFPDGKAQITGVYDENFKLVEIDTFLVSYNNNEIKEMRKHFDNRIKTAIKHFVEIVAGKDMKINKILINPTGKFLVGGFDGDAGLTGRKIVVDAYQGFANVGGGSLNGKDPSKVDVSGAYKARELAVRFLEEHNLKWCEVQLSYAIGIDSPMAIYVNSDKGYLDVDSNIYEECKPLNIIKDLKMLEIDYEKQAQFGHFTKKDI